MNEYAITKLIHIGALIFWLGPALGAWLVYKSVDTEQNKKSSLAKTVSRVFYQMIMLEHIALAALLITGILLAIQANWFSVPWLQQKLYLVGLIIIPLEVADIVLGNWLANRASGKLFSGQTLTEKEHWAHQFYHGLFTKIALILIPVSVTLIMYLAISKTGF